MAHRRPHGLLAEGGSAAENRAPAAIGIGVFAARDPALRHLTRFNRDR